MGAHTEWGGYIIDYRKVRNFNCPDLSQTTVSGWPFCKLLGTLFQDFFDTRAQIGHLSLTNES